MIPNLETKANNEKYFKSIRYFSHSLEGEKRRAFISEVGDHNIYLAAQCIMSAEKDKDFEKTLIAKSESFARDFNNSEKSAKGFLALAELESFEIISNLLLEVIKPSKIHSQVLINILEGNNQATFVSFIEILIKVQKIPFIHYAINAFNGQLIVNSENRIVLRNLFELLFANGNFGMARLTLEKFNLYGEIQYILDKEPVKIISALLDSNKKLLTASRLAYLICIQFDKLKQFPPEKFIELSLKKKGKSNKGLVFATEIAIRHGIKENKWINAELIRLMGVPNKKIRNKVNQLIKIGLHEYLSTDEFLLNKFQTFLSAPTLNEIKSNHRKPKHIRLDNIESANHYSKTGQYLKEAISPTLIHEQIQLFFYNPGRKLIDNFIQELVKEHDTTLMHISHMFRAFEFEGSIKYLLDYGCYVQPFQFRASKLLFLHKNHIIDDKEISHPSELVKEGDAIKFRIIGINLENYRLNISCLKTFKPKETMDTENNI
jgi:hypothetical protein